MTLPNGRLFELRYFNPLEDTLYRVDQATSEAAIFNTQHHVNDAKRWFKVEATARHLVDNYFRDELDAYVPELELVDQVEDPNMLAVLNCMSNLYTTCCQDYRMISLWLHISHGSMATDQFYQGCIAMSGWFGNPDITRQAYEARAYCRALEERLPLRSRAGTMRENTFMWTVLQCISPEIEHCFDRLSTALNDVLYPPIPITGSEVIPRVEEWALDVDTYAQSQANEAENQVATVVAGDEPQAGSFDPIPGRVEFAERRARQGDSIFSVIPNFTDVSLVAVMARVYSGRRGYARDILTRLCGHLEYVYSGEAPLNALCTIVYVLGNPWFYRCGPAFQVMAHDPEPDWREVEEEVVPYIRQHIEGYLSWDHVEGRTREFAKTFSVYLPDEVDHLPTQVANLFGLGVLLADVPWITWEGEGE